MVGTKKIAYSAVSRWVNGFALRRAEREARLSAREWESTIRRTHRCVESLLRENDPSVFSVLIAARSAERYLGDCLDSILHSELPADVEVEVVVAVDSCSATLAAVQRYRSALPADMAARLRVINFQQHCGLFVIRNSLLLASRGSLVQFVDADDALMPGALAMMYSFMRSCAAVTPSFLIRPMSVTCDARLAPLPEKKPFQIKGAIGLSKAALDRLGGFVPWPCAGDRDFLRRAENAGISAFAIPEPAILYRQHSGQLTQMPDTGMKSGLRAHYWAEVERRSASGVVKEVPIVGVPDV